MILPGAAPGDEPYLSWTYIRDHADQLASATQEHVELTLAAVAIGLAVSLPLAVLAYRVKPLATPLLAVTGVLYSIPAIAVIVALVPPLGLSRLTVLIPLSAYTLVILVRNILTGLQGVPADAREAALGMGFGPARMLLKVELPLALPAIVAGIRLATVSTIALATIGGYVGYGGLGNLIFQGLSSLYRTEVATASLLAVLLALVADVLLLGLQRLATPWARRAG